jgi:regulator of protease activity HflC (stomatin/prohibitin superfamily)
MATFLTSLFCILFVAILLGFILLASAFRKVPDNEQWVVTRLGDTFVKRPGWTMQLPLIDHVVKVDMGESPTNIQDQICITSDHASAIIHMLVYSRVRDPLKFASQADRNRPDLHHLFSSTLKQMVSTRPLDQVLSARDELGTAISEKLNAEIDPALGLHIEQVKVMEIVVSKEVLASMPVPGEFPPECPACGAPLNSTGSTGLHQLKCEYCGYMVPSGTAAAKK